MDDTEALFRKIDGILLHEERPSAALEALELSGALRTPECGAFSILSVLRKVKQSPVWHPEGSVWAHTLLVVDRAACCRPLSRDARALMWASLLHDVGKARTTRHRKGKIVSYGHEKAGAEMASALLSPLAGETFAAKVGMLVRRHMEPFALRIGRSAETAEAAGAAKAGESAEVALLSLCDRLGRGAMTPDKEREEKENYRRYLLRHAPSYVREPDFSSLQTGAK